MTSTSPGGPGRPSSPPERLASPPVRLEPVARHDHTVPWVGVLVAAFLLVAIAKPWSAARPTSSPPTRPTAGPSLVSRPPAPVASTAPALDGSDDACFTSLWWATFVEGTQSHELRTWYRVEPVPATGATDATIPTVRLFASAPWALGFCVSQLDSVRGVATVNAWSVDPRTGAAAEVDLERVGGVSPIDCDRGGLFAGTHVAPGAAETGAPPVWAPGHYVFHVSFGQPEGSSEWFGIEIVPVREVSLDVGADRPAPSSSVGPRGLEGPNRETVVP